ncbi:beta-galactosidase GalB [Pelagicoccus sp. SDUM812003]|uniref:beta-galactosidase GalB n=1 Tax=Pelagicoccus sp. SDUM812003 TaxID=3041267 RepID=UPI00280CE7BF|nr:beta-galactosidase GalB [Pelagicoccus sp. SDUM812003]MDQ8201837.1 beta-galactosidase GalB [Pelagicoccus sp. SDUM812003]
MKRFSTALFFLVSCFLPIVSISWLEASSPVDSPRERISINADWRFMKYDSVEESDRLIYDVRPEVTETEDGKQADAEPTEAIGVEAKQPVLKEWILPSANPFISDPKQRHARPTGKSPGSEFPFVQDGFDDSSWEKVTLPHDWAIKGPFMEGDEAPVGGGMGRLPSPGVAWYRKDLEIPASDESKRIFLDIDGAMSYAMVWLNGELVGGWPYGYASFRLDLTPYVNFGGANQLAIRIDNPPHSSRWYPGGGIYRNVWLTKTAPLHVAHWGTYVTTPEVSHAKARVELEVVLENDSQRSAKAKVETALYALDGMGRAEGDAVAMFPSLEVQIGAGGSQTVQGFVDIENPRLWGPYATQSPNRYLAITTVKDGKKMVDRYETPFGIRSIEFDGRKGFFINGEPVEFKGVNQHHDLGALGAAFNVRAAERQLETLQELGCNAVRMAHNPPARELLELCDRMGILVINEIYDVWERKKTPLDFHLIFPDWSEPDLRAFLRRDRNHPSVIMWSIGNEVGEQYTGEDGAAVAQRLHEITKQEDPTRPTAASFNFAKPHMPITAVMDSITLNYQGEGIRNAPAYAHLKGINTPPLYPDFHDKYPDKLIVSSENAAAVSSRGEYLFPVAEGFSAPVADGAGGDPQTAHVSSYELYTAQFGSSADKVFRSLDRHPYVGGGFVWSGWDYLGEPTPYYSARSSYFGVIDLAGFKKDRFYLYQSYWRPDYPMAHILPHWNWRGREGEVTPVHVFTSGDEAELFLNGRSLGRKIKGEFEYRLRWDDVVYEPGELKVISYKNGEKWASAEVKTTGQPALLKVKADRAIIEGDGEDLSFVSVSVHDEHGNFVRNAKTPLSFSIEGPAEIVATDNGDPTSMVEFQSTEREAFNGLCLAIVRGKPEAKGIATLIVEAEGMTPVSAAIQFK